MPSSFVLEYAKSGRASCKKCKEKILKGELRIQRISEANDMKMSNNFHVQCTARPKEYKNDIEGFVRDILQDETGENILDTEEGIERIILEVSKGPKSAEAKSKIKSEAVDGVNSNGGKLSRASAALAISRKIKKEQDDNDDADERPKKKSKKQKVKHEDTPLNPSDLTDVDRHRGDVLAIYEKMGVNELKDFLRWNRQVLKGTKPTLLLKCLDGHMNGRIGKCPMCKHGKLSLCEEDEGDTITCTGYFNEEVSGRFSCSFTCKYSDVPRFKWFMEKPSEEEEAEMDSEENQEDSSAKNVADKMASAIGKDTEFNLNNRAGIREAVEHYVDVCKEFKVNLPEDEATRQVGTLLISDKSLSVSEFCLVLCKKFGMKRSEEEDQKRRDMISSQCVCSSNGPIFEVITELGNFYEKEGNRNATNSYRKVANAIKNLDYEITADNAMGLSKGRTKVAGIGKGSAEKMKEFLLTGKIEKLEEKRLANA